MIIKNIIYFGIVMWPWVSKLLMFSFFLFFLSSQSVPEFPKFCQQSTWLVEKSGCAWTVDGISLNFQQKHKIACISFRVLLHTKYLALLCKHLLCFARFSSYFWIYCNDTFYLYLRYFIKNFILVQMTLYLYTWNLVNNTLMHSYMTFVTGEIMLVTKAEK